MATENKEIEILQHIISYWYDNDQEMPEHEQEHVSKMISEGYNQGELNCLSQKDEEIRGWWKIIKN